MTEKCWSLDEEEFFDDWCSLLDALKYRGLGEGAEYFEGDKIPCKIKHYIDLHSIESFLEQCDEWVYDDIGECYDNCFTNVPTEAKIELQGLIQQWAEKYVSIPYWTVKNIVKKVITKEDLE